MNELFIKAGINPLEDLDYIPNYYFSGSDITDIVIPNDIHVIGRGSFFDCKSLSSVTIPNSVTQIKTVAFYGCTYLKYINYRGTRADWRLIKLGKDWCYNILYRCIVHCIDGNINL